MAVDTANNDRIVGIRAHRVEYKGGQEKESPENITDRKVPALIRYAYKNFNPFEKLNVDKYLHFKFLCVDRNYRGRNISVKMMESTFDFMRKENIPLAYVFATSFYSQAVFKKLGFGMVDSMDYADYKVNGQVVFAPDPIHKGWATFIKWI